MFAQLIALSAAATLSSGLSDRAATGAVMGHWYTPDRASIIEIYDCGDATPCGRVAWLDRETAKVTRDEQNRDPALRGRPILGMKLLHSFEPAAQGWTDGQIYNPEDGNTYKAKLMRLEDGRLQVKGCVGPICQGQVWTEAPAPLPGAGPSAAGATR